MLDACGTMICPYFGITFLTFFMKIFSNEHIKLTHYSKTNVRPAAQVLSSANKVLLVYGPLEQKLQKQHAFVY